MADVFVHKDCYRRLQVTRSMASLETDLEAIDPSNGRQFNTLLNIGQVVAVCLSPTRITTNVRVSL